MNKLFWPIALMRGLVAASMLTAAMTGGSALAQSRGGASAHAVALAYDSGSGELLKADAHGIYRSGNGGKSWVLVPGPPAPAGRIDAIAAPAKSKTALYVAGPGMGVWRTADDGAHWSERDKGLPSREVTAFAAHATLPNTLYAYVPQRGIYRSENAGRAWRLMDSGPKEGIRQLIHTNMPGSMQTGWLFAATSRGVRRIMDCFCLWQNAGHFASGAYRVAYNPKQPKHVFVATKRALFRSTDGGETWSKTASPRSELAGLAFTNSGVLFAIAPDGALFRSSNEGRSWEKVRA